MSVKVHESFCLDSISQRCDGFDHFWGDSLDARWRTVLISGATASVIDAVDGGIIRLGTPTASDDAILDWGNIRTLHVNKKLTVEARVRANGGVTDTSRAIRFGDGVNNQIDILHGYDTTTLVARCMNGGVPSTFNMDDALDGNFHIYKIECFPTGEVHFYRDDVEETNSPITTNIPSDAGDYLQPYFRILTNADTDPATSMDIDYVWWRQDR